MEVGTIGKWNKSEGDEFAAGDIFCEVETDKATVDFEAQDDGFVARILAEAGSAEIKCGEPIMITVESAEDVDAFKDYVVEPSAAAAAPAAAEPAAPPPPEPAAPPPPAAAAPAPAAAPAAAPAPASAAPPMGGRVVASPLAHTLAKELGFGPLAALNIVGTGPGGRIIAADVREYVPPAAGAEVAAEAPSAAAAAAPAPAPGAAAIAVPAAPPVPGIGYTDYPLSPAAMEIAAQLAHSKQNVPHYYLTVDVALDSLLETRAALNASLNLGEDNAGIAVNDLLIKAAAAAMKAVPSANASWMDTAVRVYDSVDVNVVVGNGDALYAPVVRDAGRRGVKAISDDVAAAVAKLGGGEDDEAGAGIAGEEFGAVGTVTVMNLGMYGVKSCAPIVREPQAVALALGAIENRIVPNDDEESEEIYRESVMLTATLSCDHRVVDGAVGAQWLSAFKSHVENPATLLL